jgi:prefoldin subunit 5
MIFPMNTATAQDPVERQAQVLLTKDELPKQQEQVRAVCATIRTQCEVLQHRIGQLMHAWQSSEQVVPDVQEASSKDSNANAEAIAAWDECKRNAAVLLLVTEEAITAGDRGENVVARMSQMTTLASQWNGISTLLHAMSKNLEVHGGEFADLLAKIDTLQESIAREANEVQTLLPKEGVYKAESDGQRRKREGRIAHLRDKEREDRQKLEKKEGAVRSNRENGLTREVRHEANGQPSHATSFPQQLRQLAQQLDQIEPSRVPQIADARTTFPAVYDQARKSVEQLEKARREQQISEACVKMDAMLDAVTADRMAAFAEAVAATRNYSTNAAANGNPLPSSEFSAVLSATYRDGINRFVNFWSVFSEAQKHANSIPGDFDLAMDAMQRLLDQYEEQLAKMNAALNRLSAEWLQIREQNEEDTHHVATRLNKITDRYDQQSIERQRKAEKISYLQNIRSLTVVSSPIAATLRWVRGFQSNGASH